MARGRAAQRELDVRSDFPPSEAAAVYGTNFQISDVASWTQQIIASMAPTH
jgi:hypothetical protein